VALWKSAAVCLWEGKSLRASLYAYIAQEAASDHATGRIPSVFPLNLAKNSASHPDFILINVEQSSLSEVEYNDHAAEANDVILDTIFGAEIWQSSQASTTSYGLVLQVISITTMRLIE
jgi:hypothetical protein